MTENGLPKIVPLGDSAVLVEFGNEISADLNEESIALASHLELNPFRGYIEAVPAYASVAVFYDPILVVRDSRRESAAFDIVRSKIVNALALGRQAASVGRDMVVQGQFGGEFGCDLDEVAGLAGMRPDDVIGIFTAATYRVFMLGFLPGFSYMGTLDQRIATPRRAVPRALVAKGSIGIAGNQTGIYSLDSPGGWQIIGRTATEMFLPDAEPPSLLRPGDRVRFEPI